MRSQPTSGMRARTHGHTDTRTHGHTGTHSYLTANLIPSFTLFITPLPSLYCPDTFPLDESNIGKGYLETVGELTKCRGTSFNWQLDVERIQCKVAELFFCFKEKIKNTYVLCHISIFKFSFRSLKCNFYLRNIKTE